MDRQKLEELVEGGETIRGIATKMHVAPTTIRYWLKKFELKTNATKSKRRNYAIWWLISDSQFLSIVHESHSISECLRAIGVNVMAANYKSFLRRCKELGIEPPRGVSGGAIHPVEFTVNSHTRRDVIKRRILRDNLIPYKCALCNLPPIWNGKPLVLTLDHANGESTDNSLENLRFLCPNCDRQLPTYCYKNRKDIRGIV